MNGTEKILAVLKNSNEPMRPGDIAEKSGLDRKEVTKMLGDMKKEGKIISPERCFYSLPGCVRK